MKADLATQLSVSWSAPIVARNAVAEFSGGLVSPKTLANADSLKTGPKSVIHFGKRKRAYIKEELAVWIAEQCVVATH